MKAWLKKYKILVIVIVAVLAILLGAFGFVWHKLGLIQYGDEGGVIAGDDTEGEDSTVINEDEMAGLEEKEPQLPTSNTAWSNENVLNILLIGTDDRSEQFSTNARSDSMILLSVNRQTGGIKMVSLQRGMGVPILSGQYEGQYDWLTHIFRYGGADLLLETVRTCFNVEVDHYFRVNLQALTKAIDAVGGIDMELTAAEADEINIEITVNQKGSSDCTAGPNRLTGQQAVAYARIRKIDSDWKRVERQRKVIQALVDEAKGATLSELNALCDEVFPMVQTNFTRLQVADLLLLAPKAITAIGDVGQMTLPAKGTYGSMKGLGGRTLYAVNFEENARILKEFLYDE